MKLLVVEDEHKIAHALRKGLEQENFIVDVAYDGEMGFDLASDEEYDIIILDRMLPEMVGLTVCQKLRDKGNHTPILMLTAKGETQDKVDGLNAGADDYLAKPFAFAELLARLKALSRRPRSTQGNLLEVGNLTLDTVTYEVKRNDKLIKLSKKEFALLEYLMRNKNKILSKDQIINHVWDYDAEVLHNTVEVYMRYLRNKIDRPFKDQPELLQTVRGFGYRITELES